MTQVPRSAKVVLLPYRTWCVCLEIGKFQKDDAEYSKDAKI